MSPSETGAQTGVSISPNHRQYFPPLIAVVAQGSHPLPFCLSHTALSLSLGWYTVGPSVGFSSTIPTPKSPPPTIKVSLQDVVPGPIIPPSIAQMPCSSSQTQLDPSVLAVATQASQSPLTPEHVTLSTEFIDASEQTACTLENDGLSSNLVVVVLSKHVISAIMSQDGRQLPVHAQSSAMQSSHVSSVLQQGWLVAQIDMVGMVVSFCVGNMVGIVVGFCVVSLACIAIGLFIVGTTGVFVGLALIRGFLVIGLNVSINTHTELNCIPSPPSEKPAHIALHELL
mmetsp:Transcript_1123/g.1350  ORF Transcript_1123/g.1350 Transcript_1123/m.1350 type:complete len:285 (+) Transcript_1123:237-1091(+)